MNLATLSLGDIAGFTTVMSVCPTKALFVSVEFHGGHKAVTRLARIWPPSVLQILPDLRQWYLSVLCLVYYILLLYTVVLYIGCSVYCCCTLLYYILGVMFIVVVHCCIIYCCCTLLYYMLGVMFIVVVHCCIIYCCCTLLYYILGVMFIVVVHCCIIYWV